MIAVALALAAVGTALPASAEYVRDGLRINLRTQPGNQYRIVRTLTSGERVSKLGENEEWVHVRIENGERSVGWVPKQYVVDALPASVALPRMRAQLDKARARIKALEQTLESQADSTLELETLRDEAVTLRTENMQLSGAARWRSLGMGALIAFVGVLVGVVWPRGGARGARRIKL
jgi:SH3 domain protein